MIHQHTGQGLAFMTDGIREVRSLKWEGGTGWDKMAGFAVPAYFFFFLQSRDFFLMFF